MYKRQDVVMGLRMQRERQEAGLVPSYREYSRYFGIDRERMKLAKPNAIVLHPGPLNRGVDVYKRQHKEPRMVWH